MATIKEIAEIVGVSSAAVSRVLNYDDGISIGADKKKAIFDTAERLGYKKRVIYPKIENVALLYYVEPDDEVEDGFYQSIKSELLVQAKKMNMDVTLYTDRAGMAELPDDLSAFAAIGWMNRSEINRLYAKCHRGVFICTSPDEKLFDSVRPNLDSFVTQIVDYFNEKGHRAIGFVGGCDKSIDTGERLMDVREWSFRQSAAYYGCLNEKYILLAERYTVEEGYRLGKKLASMKKRPTAVCVASDTLSVGLLQALNEAGVRIPEDIAVYSINDADIAKYLSPPLTTIHIDIPIICRTALELLQNRVINGEEITKSVFINGVTMYRKSC